MTSTSDRVIELEGPAGRLEACLSVPEDARFCAVVAHPHPLYGGTMHNGVVVQTGRRVVAMGGAALRFNFRGVGGSDGEHDRGSGEVDDLAAAESQLRLQLPGLPLWLAGYSFGAACVIARLGGSSHPSATAEPSSAVRALVLAPPLGHYDFSHLENDRTALALIIGERDDLTTPDLVARTVDRWQSVVHREIVPGAAHDLLSGARPTLLDQALDRSLRALDHLA